MLYFYSLGFQTDTWWGGIWMSRDLSFLQRSQWNFWTWAHQKWAFQPSTAKPIQAIKSRECFLLVTLEMWQNMDTMNPWKRKVKRNFIRAILGGTVDGSEIQRSPVEVGSLSHYLQGFIHPRWLARFLPSTVSLIIRGYVNTQMPWQSVWTCWVSRNPPGNLSHIRIPSCHFWVDSFPLPHVGYVLVHWRVSQIVAKRWS